MAKIVANGPEIRRVRTLAGLTQRDLARLIGITESAMSQIEAGGGMSPPNLKRAAKVLKIAIAALTAEVLTAAETCKALHISRMEFDQLVTDGELTTLGGGVTETALEEYIARRLPETVNAS